MKNLFILAGGKSSRLGFDKIDIKICGTGIIEFIDRNIGELFDEKYIVVKDKNKIKMDGFKIIEDDMVIYAPLIGIIAALKCSSSDRNFICACDMPFIKKELVKYLLSFEGYDAIVPYHRGFYEPLCCVYSRSFLDMAMYFLDKGELSLYKVMQHAKIKKVELDEITKYDSELTSFKNINTINDLEALYEQIRTAGKI